MENMTKKIWLSSPHMGGNELNYVHQAFEENWVAPLGPNVNGFEKDIEEFLSADVHASALSSGTAALHLALVQCGVQMGDEVICQSLTFSASANPICYLGARPIFVDSESSTWNICPSALEEAITDRLKNGIKPKAIIAVHLYGMPFNVDKVMEIANKFEIPVIEDAAEAFGSRYKGKACGTFGRFGVLSFNGNKIMTTSGGGALISHSFEEKKETVFLSTQAREDYPHYEHRRIGFNYRMSNVCAGIGRGQIEVLNSRIEARRAMHKFYYELFQNFPGIDLLEENSEDYFSNHWLSAIQINKEIVGVSREDLRIALLKQNIESRPLWKPMHLQPVFSETLYFGSNVSETLFNNGLCLPSGSNLDDMDRMRIKESVLNALSV